MRFLLPLMFLGCQEPFSEDRHDLAGFRIAGIGVHDGVAAAAVWSGVGPWHEASPELLWSLDGTDIGEGFSVVVPGEGELTLTAISAAGEEKTARVDVSSTHPDLSVSRAAVVLGDDLTLSGRRAIEGVTVQTTVSSDEAVRMVLDGVGNGESARWMSAGGTVMELETDAADFLAENIVFDDGTLEERTAAGDGVYPLLALSIDGLGGNRWLWVDAAVGVSDTLVRHDGRLIVSDSEVEPGLVAATLVEDAVGGVALSDVVSVTDVSEQDSLPCFPHSPMKLSWVSEGRCARPDVLGARVVLEVW